MTPAERVAQHPALAEFCAQQVLAQMAEPLPPPPSRSALLWPLKPKTSMRRYEQRPDGRQVSEAIQA